MQISDREIRNSLRLLNRGMAGESPRVRLDPEVKRRVIDQLQTLPEVRVEMVLALKRAIEESRYHVPSEKVAGKLLGRCLADSLR